MTKIEIDTAKIESEGAEIEYVSNKITYVGHCTGRDLETGLLVIVDLVDDKITWVGDDAVEKITYGV